MMSPQSMSLAVHAAMAVCALMAVVNGLRYKRRGASAFALAAAFVTLGFTLWLYSGNASMTLIYGGLIVTGILLVVEFGLRAARQPKQGPRG